MVWVNFSFDGQESVDDYILNARKKEFVNLKIVLRVVLVKVVLQVLVVQRVTFLVLRVALTLNLKTLVGQVDVIVFGLEVVLCGTGPEVAWLVEVDTEVVSHHSPHADVKLAPVEQEWFFNVLLDHP